MRFQIKDREAVSLKFLVKGRRALKFVSGGVSSAGPPCSCEIFSLFRFNFLVPLCYSKPVGYLPPSPRFHFTTIRDPIVQKMVV